MDHNLSKTNINTLAEAIKPSSFGGGVLRKLVLNTAMLCTAVFGNLSTASGNPVDDPHSNGNNSLWEVDRLFTDNPTVYVVLFEANLNDTDADARLIANAEKAVGYKAPFQWHVEVMYYDGGEWLFAGCRPPACGITPVKEFLDQHPNSTARFLSLSVSREAQSKAMQDFVKNYDGKAYSLTGASLTNCTDPVSDFLKVATGQTLKPVTRDAAKAMPKVQELFGGKFSYLWPADGRPTLFFPSQFKEFGQFVGILKTKVTREDVKKLQQRK